MSAVPLSFFTQVWIASLPDAHSHRRILHGLTANGPCSLEIGKWYYFRSQRYGFSAYFSTQSMALSRLFRKISTIFHGNLLRNSYTIDNAPPFPL